MISVKPSLRHHWPVVRIYRPELRIYHAIALLRLKREPAQ